MTGGSNEVIVNGIITVPTDGVYINVGVIKTKDDHEAESSIPGYYEYSRNNRFVWVRIDGPCADGHDFVLTDHVDATCVENGYDYYECSRCDETLTTTLGAFGHTPGDCVVIKEPTRTEKGEWEIRCEICGDLLESGEIDELKIADVTTSVDCFATIKETAKNSRIWEVTFTVTVTLTDGDGVVVGTEVVEYVIYLDGNNANLSGSYTFDDDHDLAGFTLVYDIKGNGSNIKAFSIIQN
jgi:hypothetical protein